jgi:hypothetical protein
MHGPPTGWVGVGAACVGVAVAVGVGIVTAPLSQAPAWQWVFVVHTFPSSQAAPSFPGTHPPVDVSHAPVLHGSEAQIKVMEIVHCPVSGLQGWHLGHSTILRGLQAAIPSSCITMHWPPVKHLPTNGKVQGSPSPLVPLGVHWPAWHVSPVVQSLKSSQTVPFVFGVVHVQLPSD